MDFVLIFIVQINDSLPVTLHVNRSHLVRVLADVEPGTVNKPLLQHCGGHDRSLHQPPCVLILPLRRHSH